MLEALTNSCNLDLVLNTVNAMIESTYGESFVLGIESVGKGYQEWLSGYYMYLHSRKGRVDREF